MFRCFFLLDRTNIEYSMDWTKCFVRDKPWISLPPYAWIFSRESSQRATEAWYAAEEALRAGDHHRVQRNHGSSARPEISKRPGGKFGD